MCHAAILLCLFPCPALFYCLCVGKGDFYLRFFKVSVYLFLKLRTLNFYDSVGGFPRLLFLCVLSEA